MLALACASIALVPGYSRGGPSRPSLSTSAPRPSLRRSAVVRLALEPAGADSADAPAPEPAQQEAWPEPAFSVAELQAKEQERVEAAEAAAREAAAPLTTEDGAFSAVALVTALFRVECKWHWLRPAGSPAAACNARSRPGLPRASASLGFSAAWPAGCTGLVFDIITPNP